MNQTVEYAIDRQPVTVPSGTLLGDGLSQLQQVKETRYALSGDPTTIESDAAMVLSPSCLVVLRDEKVVGILTEGDIVRLVAANPSITGLVVDDVMTHPVICLQRSEFNDAFAALTLLRQHRIRHLPLVDEHKRLVGLVTPQSLLENYHAERARTFDEQTADLRSQAERDHLLNATTQRIRQSLNLQDILTTTVTEVQQCLQAERVIVCQFQADWSAVVVAEAVLPDCMSLLGRVVCDPCFNPDWITPSGSAGGRVITDTDTADLSPCHRELLANLHIRSNLLVPIMQGDRLWGLLAAHICSAPRQWQPSELDLLEKLAGQMAIAIQQSELYQKVQNELDERQKAEATNRAILNAIPDLIQRLNRDGIRLDYRVPPNFKTLVLSEAIDGRGRSIYEGLPLNLAQQRREYVERAFETGETQVYEYELMVDGEQRFEEARIAVCGPDEVLLIVRDITDRKRAETALQQSEERFRNLVETTADWVWEMDENNVYTYTSPQCLDMLGYAPDDILGQTPFDFMAAEEAQRIKAVLTAKAIARQPFQCLEITHPHRDGHLVVFETSGVPILDAQGQFRGYRGIDRDITERKQAEIALHNLVEGTAHVTGDDFFPVLVQYLAATLGVCHAIVTELIGDQLQTRAFWSNGHIRANIAFPLAETPCQLTLQEGVYVHPGNIQHDFPQAYNLVALQAESYLGMSLLDAAGQPIGVLCVLDTAPISQPVRLQGILRVFAARAAAELERQRATESLERFNQELEVRVEERTSALSDANVRLQREIEERSRLAAILEASTDYVGISDPQGTLVWANHQMKQLMGLASEADLGHLRVSDYHPQWAVDVIDREGLPTAIQNGVWVGETALLTQDHLDIPVSQMIIAHRSAHGLVQHFSTIMRDISGRKQAEEALRLSEERLQLALEGSGDGLWDWDIATNEVYLSPRWLEMLEYGPSELPGTVNTWKQLIHPEDQPLVMAILQAHLADGSIPCAFDYRLLTKSQEWKWVANYGKVVARDADGRPLRMVGTHKDISDRKKTEQALRQSQQMLQLVLDTVPQRIFYKDRNLRYLGCNKVFAQDAGLEFPKQIIGKDDSELVWKESAPLYQKDDLDVIERNTVKINCEECQTRDDDTQLWFRITKIPLHNVMGEVIGLFGCYENISNRKLAEEQLKLSLHEKELLLKEIHHRVKNNLQIAASLLSFQLGSIEDPAVVSMFKESQDRIYSMALIHEKLYQSKDLAQINMGEYIQDLVSQLSVSYNINSHRIRHIIEADSILLPIDTAIPCGLIINELVSNIYKHAFPTPRQGEVQIKFHKDIDNQFILTVRDNGVGFPLDLDFRNTESLGLQLVCTLTEQLEGAIALNHQQGSEFELKFSELSYSDRL